MVSVTALRDPTGEIIGYLLIGTDNTPRQEVEDERMKLEQRVPTSSSTRVRSSNPASTR